MRVTMLVITAGLAAIIDWELATIGDPLSDLALLLMFWGDQRRADHPVDEREVLDGDGAGQDDWQLEAELVEHLLGGEHRRATVAIIACHGLNLLTGFTGQISLGHAAFIGVGAYTSSILVGQVGLPFIVALFFAGVMSAMIGMIFGIPSLRLRGLYLAMATIAAQFIIEFTIRRWDKLKPMF